MKRAVFIILIMVIASRVFADGPNAAFGVATQGGYFNAWENRGDGLWEGGYGYGGGLVFETMFNGTLGIQSGINCMYSLIENEYYDSTLGQTVEFKVSFTTLEVPLFLLASINRGSFSLVFLTGFTFSQILVSRISATDSTGREVSKNVLPYFGSFNMGVTAGVLCRFRITAYTDFYFGSTGTFFFTDLFEPKDGQIVHLFDVRGVVGYLFRTDIFPPR